MSRHGFLDADQVDRGVRRDLQEEARWAPSRAYHLGWSTLHTEPEPEPSPPTITHWRGVEEGMRAAGLGPDYYSVERQVAEWRRGRGDSTAADPALAAADAAADAWRIASAARAAELRAWAVYRVASAAASAADRAADRAVAADAAARAAWVAYHATDATRAKETDTTDAAEAWAVYIAARAAYRDARDEAWAVYTAEPEPEAEAEAAAWAAYHAARAAEAEAASEVYRA